MANLDLDGTRRRLVRCGAGFAGCMFGVAALAVAAPRARWVMWPMLGLLTVALLFWIRAAALWKRWDDRDG